MHYSTQNMILLLLNKTIVIHIFFFQAEDGIRDGARALQGHRARPHRAHGERHPDPRRRAEHADAARARRQDQGARDVFRQAHSGRARSTDDGRGRRPAAGIIDLGALHGAGRHAARDRQPPCAGDRESDQPVGHQGPLQPDRHRDGRQHAGRGGAVPRRRNREMGAGHHHRRGESRAMRVFIAAAVLFASTAMAQSWPARPLRYIVPFPPGAFNDTLARTLAAELPKTLGQPVIVENRPGGNTIIGTEMAAKSPPDGYTLFGAALPFSVVQTLYKTSFDVTKDFAPITLAGVTPNLLVANTGMPFNDVKGLIAY